MEIKEEDVRFNLPSELGRERLFKADYTIASDMSPRSRAKVADTLTAWSAARKRMRRAVELSARSAAAEQGYWWGDLTADTTLESDFILLELWRHPPEDGVWNPPTRPLIDKAVRSILARQLPDGGFNIYADGPSELSATVKAYTALKLAGLDYDDPRSDASARTDSGAGRLAGAPTATSRSI